MFFLIINYLIFSDGNLTKEEAKSLLSGSWVYNSLECNDGIETEALYEIQIGSNLENGSLNAYRTDRDDFTYNELLNKEMTEKISMAFEDCAIHEEPSSKPVILRFVTNENETLIVGYENIHLIIKIEGDDIVFLRPLSRIKSLLSRTK